jgi:hypothetical protein
MKHCLAAAAIGAALLGGLVQAETLEPRMSAQDVSAQIEPREGHIMVPILMMLVLVLTANGGDSALVAASDERLKTDVRPVGRTAHGLTVHEFRYHGRPEVWRGVMAQEVQAVRPDAVIAHATGYLMVDYGALGLSMQRVR